MTEVYLLELDGRAYQNFLNLEDAQVAGLALYRTHLGQLYPRRLSYTRQVTRWVLVEDRAPIQVSTAVGPDVMIDANLLTGVHVRRIWLSPSGDSRT